MTTPAWMPPQLPEVVAPEPDAPRRWIGVVAVVFAGVLAFGGGAFAWRLWSSTQATVGADQPGQVVDSVIANMTTGRWAEAFDAFSADCVDFGAEALQGGFEPVLATYESHDLNPLRRTDFDPQEIVLVFGSIDLGNDRANPLRAEFVFAGPEAETPWKLCGLRIDEP